MSPCDVPDEDSAHLCGASIKFSIEFWAQEKLLTSLSSRSEIDSPIAGPIWVKFKSLFHHRPENIAYAETLCLSSFSWKLLDKSAWGSWVMHENCFICIFKWIFRNLLPFLFLYSPQKRKITGKPPPRIVFFNNSSYQATSKYAELEYRTMCGKYFVFRSSPQEFLKHCNTTLWGCEYFLFTSEKYGFC